MAELPNSARGSHFFTPKEAAAYIGINPRTFYPWLRKKGGPPVRRFGRIIRIPKEKFIKWANAGTGD